MDAITFDRELDARGLKCPMPLIRARKTVGDLAVGEVLKVVATDRGSVKDFEGWARVAKNVELLGQEEQEGEGPEKLYIHYVKRTA